MKTITTLLAVMMAVTMNAQIISGVPCWCSPYKSYVAILSQQDTLAPVADVLYNDTGINIEWNYDFTGNYYTDDLPSRPFVLTGNDFSVYNTQTISTLSNGVLIQNFTLSWNYDPIPTDGFTELHIELRIFE